MADILVVGHGPLPEPGMTRSDPAALRTWQTVRPLADSPHTVHLIAVPTADRLLSNHAVEVDETGPGSRGVDEDFDSVLLPTAEASPAVEVVEKAIARHRPSCVVAVNAYPGFIASQARARLPLWVDLGDCAVLERQINARRTGDETGLEEAWTHEQALLMRADKFSVASMPRLYGLIGELAAVGRLNRLTAHYHFAHHVPHAVHPLFAHPPTAASAPPLRPREIPGDAFVVLWSGSFDSWVDVDSLFAGLEKAMAANPRVHFVATGAQVEGRDELTYRRFRAAVEASPYAMRCHLLGWVDLGRLGAIYRECDLGLNVDGKHYETLFGSRHRLIDMMAAGLPVATSLGTELSHILTEEKIGLVFPTGDADALANVLLRNADQPHALRTLGQKGRHYVTRHFTSSALAQPLLEWVDEPRLAPDNAEKGRLAPPESAFQEFPLNAIQTTQLRMAGVDVHELFQAQMDLGVIRAKWWYRLGRSAKRRTLAFLRRQHLIH
jgi:glycosyltransferase involved in cell wall biosynthesis